MLLTSPLPINTNTTNRKVFALLGFLLLQKVKLYSFMTQDFLLFFVWKLVFRLSMLRKFVVVVVVLFFFPLEFYRLTFTHSLIF